ncbi:MULTISPECIES: hypothetical protein [Agrobacterium]|uniref:TNase-like domain-containing protein n=1 Tax=Agrobacterium larrymoorei TaxID=160699 RepID=A0ABX8TEB9_9HYPH|nr:hypothetical protein [Agrobacterium larrymoorei]NSZ10044.1 hypothetical protein [Agrobacterium tumefaciens]QYA10846.1 hypothetical protein J5285_25815 [Agrobacterium larrymoorei]
MTTKDEKRRPFGRRIPLKFPSISFKTISLLGVAATTVFLLSQLRQDEQVNAQIEGYAEKIGQARIAANAANTPMPEVSQVPDNVLQGPVRVLDAKTFQFLNPNVKVEIAGIEICDRGQLAYFNGTPWPCEPMATAWLVSQTLGQTVQCQKLDSLYNSTVIARCGVNGADIAAEAILAGHALVDTNARLKLPIDTYKQLELRAKQNRSGLWSSSFTTPEEWRKSVYKDRMSQVRIIDRQQTPLDEL